MNYDRIYIRDLRLRSIIGLNDHERREKQDIVINIVLYADLSKPCRTDCIEDTVNYATITEEITSMVENSSFFLIEKLAEEIAAVCLKHEPVQKVKVTLDKPGALEFSRTAAVEIVRRK